MSGIKIKLYTESWGLKLDKMNECLIAVNRVQLAKLKFSKIPAAW